MCLERVLVHFGANRVALWKIMENSSSSSSWVHARADRHTYDTETGTHLHGQWLVWACCDATDVCLVRALVNRASTWVVAGFGGGH